VVVRSVDGLGEEDGDPARGDGEERRGVTMGEIALFVGAGGDVALDACACEVAVA